MVKITPVSVVSSNFKNRSVCSPSYAFPLRVDRLRCKLQLHYLDWTSTSARIWLQRSVQVAIRSWKQAAAVWCSVKDSRSYSHQYGQSFRNLNVRWFSYYHVNLSVKLLLLSYMWGKHMETKGYRALNSLFKILNSKNLHWLDWNFSLLYREKNRLKYSFLRPSGCYIGN
jgi:hypothetical protein